MHVVFMSSFSKRL
jgi:hypothetical protein